MPTIKSTLMKEDISIVNALEYSASRTDVAIELALDAIGSLFRTLVLTDEEDGIWTLGANVTIPANVLLKVPLGVTIAGTGNLTILGGIEALRWPFYVGSGVFTWSGGVLVRTANRFRADTVTTRFLEVSDGGTVTNTFHIGTHPENVPWPGPGGNQDPTSTDVSGSSVNQTTVGAELASSTAWNAIQYTTLTGNTLGPSVEMGMAAGAVLNTQTFQFTGDIRGMFAHSLVYGSGGVDQVNTVYAAIYPIDPSTITTAICFQAAGIGIGTEGVVVNYRGLQIADLEAARTSGSAYAVHSLMTGGAGRYGLYMAGNAPNYLLGNVGIGSGAITPPHALYVTGRSTLGIPNTAPTDSELANSQISFYVDQSGHNLLMRVRYSDGTLKLALVPLT